MSLAIAELYKSRPTIKACCPYAGRLFLPSETLVLKRLILFRHNRLEHMRPMLVKFPLSRSFGICKATALLHPAITAEQKFFGAWVCEFKKSKFFARKGKSAVNSLSVNEHFNALLRKICLFGPHGVRVCYA